VTNSVTKPFTKPEPSEIQTEYHPSESKTDTEPKSRGFGVAASPFNGVKIELGFAILLGAILWLAADSITGDEATQWLLLLAYGLLSMFWLVLRTRAVLHRCMTSGEMSP